MGATMSDGLKMGILMIIVCAVVTIVITLTAIVSRWNDRVSTQLNASAFVEHLDDFTAMATYGEAIPMTNVVAALDLYGMPEVLCLQMEDLKGQMGGTPYPVARSTDERRMNELIKTLRNYYGKKVYVYVATPNGQLQLCVAELPHSTNTDGANQGWEVN